MIPYGALTGFREESGGRFVEVREERLRDILLPYLLEVQLDEKWYRQQYVDVDDAINRGVVASARDHYISSGYFENRLPRAVTVDERWYLEVYPDVAEACRKGIVMSAEQHFLLDGFSEGRLPRLGWSL